MKVLLVANYPLEYNPSMHAYAQLLFCGLSSAKLDVHMIKPYPIFGRIVKKGGVGKWISYIDRFLIFPIILKVYAGKFDIIHILDHCNAVYAPFIDAKKRVITCHDMIGVRASFGDVPFTRVSFTGKILQRIILKGLRMTENVICVSEQTRKDLIVFIEDNKHNLFTVKNALRLNTENSGDPTQTIRTSTMTPLMVPYIFHVGSNMPQKNRSGILEFYKNIIDIPRFENFNLVFCGQHLSTDLLEQAKSLCLSQRVHDLGFVSDAELSYLYSKAELLIFPSLMEGFGWPIIEAQSRGCLVVTSNIKPMNEISGSGAILINPYDMRSSAQEVADQYTRRDEFIELGYANCGKYLPDKMIDELIEIYEKIAFARQKNSND